jgi:hypothetical protein
MTTEFRLGLPTDIPWQRICVTEDALDRVVCDTTLPAKWQSSIAVFRYVPPDEDQSFPDYDISFLKVTATITGYQALEDEIQGEIDWDGIDTTTVEGVTELLNSYFPCTGAIVQVVVGPHRDTRNASLDSYPFFLDFEPKKRELYEMATDTKERQSRSSETLQVGKSAATAQSQEVLDVDMGGAVSFGAEAQAASGAGGGFTFSSSNQGQWGTKSLNTQQSQTDRRREVGQELRESYSYTTQLSQMYHLLDTYHLGTNRAVFFVQPRPHVLEEPTGFVRGPRKVEGIQDFFLVVAQPKDTPEYCVSVRLDTSHLVETDILEYEQKLDVSDLANAYARIPTDQDQPADPAVKALWTACFIGCWDVRYRCFMTRAVDDVTYSAPDGFSITGYTNLVNENNHGTTSVTIAPGSKTLAIHAEAEGHIAIEAGWDVCVDCPDELEKWAGSARRQVQVNLRSDEPTAKTGTQTQLLITTRGLCCCAEGPEFGKGVVETFDIPVELGGLTRWGASGVDGWPAAATSDAPVGAAPSMLAGIELGGIGVSAGIESSAIQQRAQMCDECASGTAAVTAPGDAPRAAPKERWMTIRQANAMGDFIKGRMVNVGRGPETPPEPVPYLYSEPFVRQLTQFARRSRQGREELNKPVGRAVPRELAEALAERVGKKPNELKRRDVLGFRFKDLAKLGDSDPTAIARMQLQLLGVPVKRERERPKPKGGTRRRGRGGNEPTRSASA